MDESKGAVGAERLLAVLVALATEPDGLALDEIASQIDLPKSTVHRSLTSLRRAGFARQQDGGRYLLGDEFLRLAFAFQEHRSSAGRVEPILRELSTLFDETAHYAVLDGYEIVYQAKRDPATGAIRLSSFVGGRNPAHATAVGKLLLSYKLEGLVSVQDWIGNRDLVVKTPNTVTDPEQLAASFSTIRDQGYAVDDQESEIGVNCIAMPVFLDASSIPTGAISISGLTFRTPLGELTKKVDVARDIIRAHDIRTSQY